MNHINYPFLLAVHIVCAGQKNLGKESKSLYELATQTRVNQQTREEMKKILTQDSHHLTLEEVALKVPYEQQHEAMYLLLVVAKVNGKFCIKEQKVVEEIAQIWNWQPEEIQQRFELVELFIEKLYLEMILSGKDYEKAVIQCANIAQEDYHFAEKALKKTGSILLNLKTTLNQQINTVQINYKNKTQATTAKEVSQQLEETQKSLQNDISDKIEDVRRSLRSKESALSHFTIAFMGKTKAGKSTLHAILSHQGWDAIGEGKQRTTRENRVYEWNNIRVIDTPGIGAPGGKSDEEIAKSVIEESDLICYVVTNDSIQETEFQFLHLLKKNSKPLIILLNVKHNLRDTRRLDYFLKYPDKPFAMEGKSGLGGHIERIRRYAKEHYTNDYFPIIPVMLLAAQLSHEPEHQHHKATLFKASRMQDFLDALQQSIIDYGTIRRSQTLLGSTVYPINKPHDWVKQQAQGYQQLAEILIKKQKDTHIKIKIAQQDSFEDSKTQIEAIFNTAINMVPHFAEQNWDSEGRILQQRWQRELNSFNFQKRLNQAFKAAGQQFNDEVQETLDELGNELKLIAKLSYDSFNFDTQDSFNTRNFFRFGGGILLTIGTALAFIAPPVGIAIGIVGGLMSMASGLFKSRDEKRREAVKSISKSLRNQLYTFKKKALQEAENDFNNYSNSMKNKIDSYFYQLISGLEYLSQQLQEAEQNLQTQADTLNQAYAKRIIDWCQDKYEPLTEAKIQQTVARVHREFGKYIHITPHSKFTLKKSPDELKQVLQENVYLSFSQ
jgi:GTP-binding protein EngB required for normal cell division